MDNATNYAENLDTLRRDWTFSVRFTREEIHAIQRIARTPHPAHMDNFSLLEESKRIAESCTFLLNDGTEGNFHYSHYGLSGDKTIIYMMTHDQLWMLNGIIQNPHPDLGQGMDKILGDIFFGIRALLEEAKIHAIPEA